MVQERKQNNQNLIQRKKALTEEEIRELIQKDPDAAVFYILYLQAKISGEHPFTPSGMIPPYKKPAVKRKGSKPGQKTGHPGSRRPAPPKIGKRETHALKACPDCGGAVNACKSANSTRTRIIEDIPENIQPVVTEHTIHRSYCPHCKKLVEPKVPDALPRATIGNRLLALSAHWHYGLGMSISQIVEVLNSHLHFPVSEGGLVQMWKRLAVLLDPWYESLADTARNSAVLHADETGWRVNGKTHWLWCFTNQDTTVYMIDPSRGSPALTGFFTETFEGTLVTDFWAAYDAIAGGKRQFCLAHLLRELEKVDKTNPSAEWCAFAKKARRLFRDALRLRSQENYAPENCATRIQRLEQRLINLMLIDAEDADVKRLAKRLKKYWDELLTFLSCPEVPATNNHAEREIRPAVIMRKVMQGNRSDKGAQTQSVLMTVFRTLKRRNLNPVDIITESLKHTISTGTLPAITSFG